MMFKIDKPKTAIQKKNIKKIVSPTLLVDGNIGQLDRDIDVVLVMQVLIRLPISI